MLAKVIAMIAGKDDGGAVAEPKSIEELRREGFNALPCSKGPDSVRAGVDFVRELTVHMVDGRSHNTKREQRSYVYKKDRDGGCLPIPIEYNDHAMSAARYGFWTHLKDRPVAPRAWIPGVDLEAKEKEAEQAGAEA